MKHNLFIIIGIILFILAVMVIGNIIIIGEKIGTIFHLWWMEYVFYGLLLILTSYYILGPFLRIHRAVPFPVLNLEDKTAAAQLYDFGNQLVSNCRYLSNETQGVDGEKSNSIRMRHQQDLKAQLAEASKDEEQLRKIIQAELDLRFQGDKTLQVLGIDSRIREWAKSVFMITAISQNSRFDTFSIMYLNLRMIADIINASGFRPTHRQLYRMYGSILSTALITYSISEALITTGSVSPFDIGDLEASPDDATDAIDDVNIDEDYTDIGADPEGFSLYSILRRIKIPGIVVGAALDGTINALLTLRIGYITRAYLKQGASSLDGINNKRAVKRQAMMDAMLNIPYVISAGSGVIGKRTSLFLLHLVRPETRTPSFLKILREKLRKNIF
ncbi:MAG: hypothetical protein E7105_00230 [Prevotella sp.]|nr:hypothetical protein [Prevotella sp.]